MAAWGTLAASASASFRARRSSRSAVALYTTIPIAAFAVWRGWPFYPGRVFRLLVVRPFWYAQLLLPLVSAAGLVGLVLGAPFGRALVVGRALAGTMLTVAVIVLVLGYIGARRLVVRRVDAEVPGLGAEFDGLRIVQLSDLHVGPHTSRQFLDRVVKTTQSLAPTSSPSPAI